MNALDVLQLACSGDEAPRLCWHWTWRNVASGSADRVAAAIALLVVAAWLAVALRKDSAR